MFASLKRHKILVIICLCLVALGWGGYEYYLAKGEDARPIRNSLVQRGDLTEKISATGALSAVDNVDISSKITGRIVDVLVTENQHVQAGDVLVRLDDTALKATMMQMQAKLNNAAANYERYQRLLQRGAVSQYDYDNVEANYLVAKTNYDKAASDVQDTIITTPIDGYIIGKPTPVGQTISSGISTPQVIMSVATLDKMQIEAMVDESDIGQVRIGQKVTFTVDAYPEEEFQGTVRLISRKAETENNVIYYKVYVDVADAKGKLLPTMTARAEFIVAEANNELLIPLSCLHTDEEGCSYVRVVNKETKAVTEVNVETGNSDERRVVVFSDELKEGDTLLHKKLVARQSGYLSRRERR